MDSEGSESRLQEFAHTIQKPPPAFQMPSTTGFVPSSAAVQTPLKGKSKMPDATTYSPFAANSTIIRTPQQPPLNTNLEAKVDELSSQVALLLSKNYNSNA